MDPLDVALTQCLIDHKLRIEDRERQRTALSWPDVSDIVTDTRRTIRALCAGELDPRAYLESIEDKYVTEAAEAFDAVTQPMEEARPKPSCPHEHVGRADYVHQRPFWKCDRCNHEFVPAGTLADQA